MNETIALTEGVFYILLSVYKAPMHGYGIMQNVTQLTKGRLNIGAGTLYGAINTLLEKNWIKNEQGENPRKKEYTITELGKQAVSAEISRLDELILNGKNILGVQL